MKKILVTSTQFPYYGGSASNAYSIIKFLREKNYRVAGLFFTRNNADPDEIGGIFNIDQRIKNKDRIIGKIRNYLSGIPDCILSKNYIAPYLSRVLFKKTKIIYLVSGSYHMTELSKKNMSAISFLNSNFELDPFGLEERSVKVSDLVIPNSKISYSIFSKIYNKYEDKIYDPINTSSIQHNYNIECERVLWKKRFMDIGFVSSRLDRKIKNTFWANKIFKNESLKDYSKFLVGGSHKFSKKYKIHELPRLKHSKLIKLLNNTKVVICPSYFDSSPNIIEEALACGCNVVLSKNCGWSELFDEYCVCEDVYDVEDWVKKIQDNLIYSIQCREDYDFDVLNKLERVMF